jgi:uncharacterized membrane protein
MEENNSNPDQTNMEENASHWFLGVFYFNPKDKRLLPPKRFPLMGWTVNFANPYSIALIILIIAAILFIRRLA